MKKNLFLIAILSLVLFACGPVGSDATTDTAIDYDKDLIEIQYEVDGLIVVLHDEIKNGDEAIIRKAQENAAKVIDDAIKSVNDMDDFDGKDDYKNAMLELLEMYKGILEIELKEISDYFIYFDDMAEAEMDYINEVQDLASVKYEEALEKFTAFRNDFADEWEFTIK